MKKIIALVLVFVITCFGNEFTNNETSVFSNSTEPNVIISSEFNKTKNLYLSYLSYPKYVYKNQRFEIIVKALVTRNDIDLIQTKFLNGDKISPLNPQNQWVKQDKSRNTYINSYYFKAEENDFKMPDIQVDLYKNNQLVESRVLNQKEIRFSKIATNDDRYSNVIANKLTVLGSKAKQYTNKQALVVIDLEGDSSNLEDFNIKGIEEQGITSIEDNYPKQHMIYYLVVPVHKKSIVFNYYNLTKSSLEKIIVPISFQEELVSTQTDLNPNNSSFEFYKKIAFGVLAVIFLLLFIWKRKFLFLVLFLVISIIFVIFIIPNKIIKLKKDTVIYILPTKNSTIFRKTKDEVLVEDMKRKNGFVKIIFKNGENNFIGWVKEKDVIED